MPYFCLSNSNSNSISLNGFHIYFLEYIYQQMNRTCRPSFSIPGIMNGVPSYTIHLHYSVIQYHGLKQKCIHKYVIENYIRTVFASCSVAAISLIQWDGYRKHLAKLHLYLALNIGSIKHTHIHTMAVFESAGFCSTLYRFLCEWHKLTRLYLVLLLLHITESFHTVFRRRLYIWIQ